MTRLSGFSTCLYDVNIGACDLQELYESRGRTYVTVIPSPEPGTLMDGQVACYEQCFRMAKDDTDWFIAIVSHCPDCPAAHNPLAVCA